MRSLYVKLDCKCKQCEPCYYLKNMVCFSLCFKGKLDT